MEKKNKAWVRHTPEGHFYIKLENEREVNNRTKIQGTENGV